MSSYTFNDFVMESAMVENTNDTDIYDIEMEQFVAEYNVAMAGFEAFNKYSLIAEYAQCDVEEYFQESLDDKINKVEDWKNSGGKAKKALGTAFAAVLKMFRAVANFFKRLFGRDTNPFAKLAKTIRNRKGMSKKALQAKLSDTEGRLSATENKLGEARRNLAASEKELASTKGKLAATEGKLSATQEKLFNKSEELGNVKRELAESKEGVKKLGQLAAGYKAQYLATEKALDETKAALENLMKAKSESDAATKKAQDLLSEANGILAKFAGSHNRFQAKKYNKEAYNFLNRKDIDHFGNHAEAAAAAAAAEAKKLETMDDIANFLEKDVAPLSKSVTEKAGKIVVMMDDINGNPEKKAMLPAVIVNTMQKIASSTDSVGKNALTVADIQKQIMADPSLASLVIE